MNEVVAGLDIGGTNSAIGIVDRSGNCLSSSVIPTAAFAEVDQFVAAGEQAIRELLHNNPEWKLAGIGIGAPNGNYYRGTIEFAPNLHWKGIIPLADLFGKRFGVKSVLTNDANAAAIGEMIFGGAKGMRDFIIITLGTGVGSGIVVNGELVYGHDGFAGEIGHTIYDPNGRDCGCGRKGCLETYTSAGGIKRTLFELMGQRNTKSSFRGKSFDEITAADIATAATAGDELALEAFDITGKILGLKLADSVAHTSPEAIFLFGGLAKSGKLIFEPTQRYMEENMLNIFKNKVKLLPSLLKEENVAILGAAALAWKELDK